MLACPYPNFEYCQFALQNTFWSKVMSALMAFTGIISLLILELLEVIAWMIEQSRMDGCVNTAQDFDTKD